MHYIQVFNIDLINLRNLTSYIWCERRHFELISKFMIFKSLTCYLWGCLSCKKKEEEEILWCISIYSIYLWYYDNLNCSLGLYFVYIHTIWDILFFLIITSFKTKQLFFLTHKVFAAHVSFWLQVTIWANSMDFS